MAGFEAIEQKVQGRGARIVLAEGEDPRVIAAARQALQDNIAQPILIGDPNCILTQWGESTKTPRMVDPSDPPDAGELIESYLACRARKGTDREQPCAAIREPLTLAALLMLRGEADGAIAGAVATSEATIRASLQVLDCAPETKLVSSFFLIDFADTQLADKGVVAFADCGMVVEPTVDQLVQIAVSTAGSYTALTGEAARIAMLSFSTHGSTLHERAQRMVKATDLVRQQRPDLMIDGELQFDAAMVPEVAAVKAPDSPLVGAANVLVFPDLEAANIGYKIAQRLGGATAIGPILQGLSKPYNDLSRGCSADDIVKMIAVTAAQGLTSA